MPHYDLTAARAAMAADLAADQELDAERIADGTDAKFVAAHRRFDAVRIDFIIEAMRCENDGLGRDQALAAAARALGMLLGSLSVSCVGARERALIKGCFESALSEAIIGPADPNQARAETTIKAEEGGHA